MTNQLESAKLVAYPLMFGFAFDRKPARTALVLALLFFGCRRSAEVPHSLPPGKASSELERVFSTGPVPELKQTAKIASAALRKRDYEAAFLILRKIEASPKLTDSQGLAVRDALIGVQQELARAVVNGDPKAIETAKRLRATK